MRSRANAVSASITTHEHKDLGCVLCNVQDYEVRAEIHYLDSSSNYREYLPHLDIRQNVFEPSTWILGAILLFASVIIYLIS